MNREIYKDLLEWKNSTRRKPLILQGARQVGKTYILKKFGAENYESVAYLNFEENPDLDSIFKKKLEVRRLASDLGLIAEVEVKPGKTLIIFDEIQASNFCLNALKFFNENANEYHVVSAGSLLGLKLSKPRSVPVGKVNFLHMFPLNFVEFLRALGKDAYADKISTVGSKEALPVIIHNELNELLKSYFVVGGMPEVVSVYLEEGSYKSVREVQVEILKGYELDFSKHAPGTDIPKISLIWNSIPSQLAKENKKFIYSCVRSGARAREYESALQWLFDASLIHRCSHISTPRMPLRSYASDSVFKIYMADTGLLAAMSQLEIKKIVEGDEIFTAFTGAFTENFVAQQLAGSDSKQLRGLYYWTSEATAEVDFLFQKGSEIRPLEVKSGENVKSKSLKVFHDKYDLFSYRTSPLSYVEQEWMKKVPLYAVHTIL